MSLAAQAGRILTRALSLVPALPQAVTNGWSTYGTLDVTPLNPFIWDNRPQPGFPWGNLTAEDSNPEDPPTTGVTRKYEFTIARGYISPDGFQKEALLVNGQYPGPLIEANWGDMISVTVNNNITGPDEGTSLHWHGFLQKATPWYDGVPSVSQCPIAPRSSFTYTFRADIYGTTWYHSHYSAQYSAGVLGPMIVHGPVPKANPYDIDLGPVLLTDWYHTPYAEILDYVHSPGENIPRSDNNLINGKMYFNCSTLANNTSPCTNNAGLSKFRFQTGKTHRIRVINAATEGLQRFTIDEHEFTVIANDFVPIKPYTTKVLTLSPGQRNDVLVTANVGRPDSKYWMRSNISTICSNTNQAYAKAVIYYDRADPNSIPYSTPYNIPDPGTCANEPLNKTVPLYSMTPTPNPTTTITLQINAGLDSTGRLLWYFNSSSYIPNVDDPLLLLANEGNFSYPMDPQWNVYDTDENTSVRVILINNSPAQHPMHLHGHNMYLLAEGYGSWNGTVVNPSNPQRRDTLQSVACIFDAKFNCVPGGLSYNVFQINANNPGVWPFHCHVAWHLAAGLYANILERPLNIDKLQIPADVPQTCTKWNKYINSSSYNKEDPGLTD